jgi:predicted alpha-1,6-mannanase (GH76 family)
MTLRSSARAAATTLKQWYGADSFAASTGLFSWTDPDLAADLAGEFGVPNAVGWALAKLLKASGQLIADMFPDTECWWNDANAITAWVDYMLACDDRQFLPEVEATFEQAQLAWVPNVAAVAAGVIGAGLGGALAGVLAGFAIGGLIGAIVGGVVGAVVGIFGGGNAAMRSKPGKTYMTNFINGHYDDEGWWALAWLRAHDLNPDARYLSMAVTIFNDIARSWDNVLGGGVYWQPNQKGPSGQKPYKNAITNELFMAIAAKLYLKLAQTPPDWVYFRGTDNKLWQVTGDGSQQTWIGNGFKTKATPFVTNDGWIYFQGTDDKLWKVDINGNNANWLGGNKTAATPVVVNGWVYFRGTDNKLWKIDVNGQNGTWLGYKTKSTPFVTGLGLIFFQGTDDKLWAIDTNGQNGMWLGGNKTAATPFVANGWVYFQGTDDKLWKIDISGLNGVWLGYKTKSAPFVTEDGWIYFQGTDDKLWKVDINGQNGNWLGNNKTASTPFAAQDGWVYFQGTDKKLWRIFNDGTQQSQINGNKTSATPFVSTSGPPAYATYENWALKTWSWFSDPNTGMFNPSGLVMDSPDNPNAAEASDKIWTYNQGVILSALSDMTQITGDIQYQLRAQQIADIFLSNGAVPGAQSGVTSGILTEMTDDTPDGPGHNLIDCRQFKGIFMRNLAYLYLQQKLPAYRAFILTNCNSAVANATNPAGTNEYGANWSGPYDNADFIRQNAALQLLAAGCFVE